MTSSSVYLFLSPSSLLLSSTTSSSHPPSSFQSPFFVSFASFISTTSSLCRIEHILRQPLTGESFHIPFPLLVMSTCLAGDLNDLACCLGYGCIYPSWDVSHIQTPHLSVQAEDSGFTTSLAASTERFGNIIEQCLPVDVPSLQDV